VKKNLSVFGLKHLVCLTLVYVVALVGMRPANAAGLQSVSPQDTVPGWKRAAQRFQNPQSLEEVQRNEAEMDRAVAALEPYVRMSDDRRAIVMSEVDPRALGIAPDVFENLTASLQRTNDMLRNGEIRFTGEGLDMEFVNDGGVKAKMLMASLPQCTPQAWVKVKWWGVRIELNQCATLLLIKVLEGAIAASVLLNALGLVGTAASVLIMLIGLLTVIWVKAVNRGNGVVLKWTWVGIFWFSAR
jgi:hypothetical protein